MVKPDSYKFEALALVRDGSKSSETKNVFEKGYHVKEACVLTDSNHPVSIFSRIHSSKEKNFTSVNNITFSAMERSFATSARERARLLLFASARTTTQVLPAGKGICGILSYAKEGV